MSAGKDPSKKIPKDSVVRKYDSIAREIMGEKAGTLAERAARKMWFNAINEVDEKDQKFALEVAEELGWC